MKTNNYFSIKSVTAVTLLGTTVALSSCMMPNAYTGETQVSDTTKGAGLGALGGAAIGALAHGGKGALIGAGVGSLVGGTIGYSMDRQNEELRRVLVGTGVQVNRQGNMITLVMASDVTFAFNSSDINSRFFPPLNSVAMVLNKYNNTDIRVTGFTDNVGKPAYNQQLSEKRARSVADYLVSQRVSPARFVVNGMGQRYPVASNANAQGRAQNRRVEIQLQPRN